uniref:Col_cuticle_N domain-containing protein n=1 Tax=Globodera pallida TaxID=36090 RepID=A0A183BSI1_GLOPA
MMCKRMLSKLNTPQFVTKTRKTKLRKLLMMLVAFAPLLTLMVFFNGTFSLPKAKETLVAEVDGTITLFGGEEWIVVFNLMT